MSSAVLLRRLFYGKDLKLAQRARTEILPVRYARKTAELIPNRLPGECWPLVDALRRTVIGGRSSVYCPECQK